MRQPPLSVEAALRLKDELKLTDAQASQLEALRKEIVADRQAHARDMIDTQSRVAAGLLKPDDVRKQVEDKHDALRQTMQQRQDRIAKVLTTDQQQQLARAEFRHMRERMGGHGRGGHGQRMRPGGFGRRDFGHGMRRGFRPGRMGPGFGPGFEN
jgi:Spy/CpxP family protein refolding chaperone